MKQDQRRLSKEEWEVDYARRLAKELLEQAKNNKYFVIAKTSKIKRVAQLALKYHKPTKKVTR